MNIFLIIGVAMGALGITQPILNASIINQYGLYGMAFINGLVGLIATAVIYFGFLLFPAIFPSVQSINSAAHFKWWYIIPPLSGILPLFLMPLIMRNLGAFSAVVATIFGQIITCFIFDAVKDFNNVSTLRVLGLILAAVSVFLSFK